MATSWYCQTRASSGDTCYYGSTTAYNELYKEPKKKQPAISEKKIQKLLWLRGK